MNDNDLERRLRSEPGPRERGYHASVLPVSLDQGHSVRRGGALLRMAVVAPAVAAGILAVVLGSALIRGDGSSGVGADASASASTSGSHVAGTPVCRNDDLAISAEPWGAAAGSRGTIVSLALADGHSTCALIPNEIAARVSEEGGTVLVTSDIPRPISRDVVMMSAAGHGSYSIVWSNWCGAAPSGPLALSISVEEGASWAAVPTPSGGADPTPPCLGESSPSTLSVTELDPAP